MNLLVEMLGGQGQGGVPLHMLFAVITSKMSEKSVWLPSTSAPAHSKIKIKNTYKFQKILKKILDVQYSVFHNRVKI